MHISGNQTGYTTRHPKHWFTWTSWLLLIATLVATPTTAIAASSGSSATSTSGPDAPTFGPSAYLPMLNNRFCSGLRDSDSPIGTQVYGSTGYNQPDFMLLQDAKPVWIRNSIVWSDIEPTNLPVSQFNWAAADRAVAAAVANCANMIVTIENTAPWAATMGDRSPIKPEFLDDYAEFVVAVVERYDGDGTADAPNGAVVNYWEFYNEPDFKDGVVKEGIVEGWGKYGAKYAEMLKTIYEPVHKANPNAKVVFGGIAYNLFADEGKGGSFVRGFFKDVLDAGGGDYFDIMNFHYYPFQHNRVEWTDTNASGLRQKYQSIKDTMSDAGIGDKPVMLTELGWHSATTNPDYPSTPIYQARRVLELLTQASTLGLTAVIWWTFDDQGPGFPYSTGLVSAAPHSVKPAYAVYQQAAQRLGNATFDSTVIAPSVGNDLEAYRFIDNNTHKAFYVAWLNPVAPPDKNAIPFDEGATQQLQLDGNSATIINRDGTIQGTVNDGDDGANDGKLTVTAGRSPIYVVLK